MAGDSNCIRTTFIIPDAVTGLSFKGPTETTHHHFAQQIQKETHKHTEKL